MLGLLTICSVTMMFCMIGKRLNTTILTAPMVFLTLGALASMTGLVPHDTAEVLLHPMAEIALVILLFLDAAQMDLHALKTRRIWSSRMLIIGQLVCRTPAFDLAIAAGHGRGPGDALVFRLVRPSGLGNCLICVARGQDAAARARRTIAYNSSQHRMDQCTPAWYFGSAGGKVVQSAGR